MKDRSVFEVELEARGFKHVRKQAKRAAKAIREARREHEKYTRRLLKLGKAVRKAGQ